MLLQLELAEEGANSSLFRAEFDIPETLLSALNTITTVVSLSNPIPLIRLVVKRLLRFLATEDGFVLCTEVGDPIAWSVA